MRKAKSGNDDDDADDGSRDLCMGEVCRRSRLVDDVSELRSSDSMTEHREDGLKPADDAAAMAASDAMLDEPAPGVGDDDSSEGGNVSKKTENGLRVTVGDTGLNMRRLCGAGRKSEDCGG